MRLSVVAVGRLKDGPDRELYQRYLERLDGLGRGLALGPLQLTELPEARGPSADARKADEAARLIKAVADADVIVALHERAKTQTSMEFANDIRSIRDSGTKTMAFVIGGPDGHHDSVLALAGQKLSLGAMTLPHGLARIVLTEQLYRAATIIAGHPYHRN